MGELIRVQDLRVSYRSYAGEVQAVRGVSFAIGEGETVALVGESGCGKSVTAKALMGLIKRVCKKTGSEKSETAASRASCNIKCEGTRQVPTHLFFYPKDQREDYKMKLTEKVDYLLEVKSKYTYRIYPNGNGEMSIEVQLTDDFKKASFRNFALVTTTKENFDRCISVDHLNELLLILKKAISEAGTYGTVKANYIPVWE